MRGRWIKPETWTSPTLSRISRDAVLLFVALWTYADDEGRGLDDPTLIRATLFPLREDVTDADVSDWLAELARARVIVRYRAAPRLRSGGSGTRKARRVLQIRAWEEHQSVSHPKESLYPGPRSRKARSGAPPERRRNRSVLSSSESQRREVVADSGGAPENPNGSGAYDPDATGPRPYDVPLPLEELEHVEPEPSSEARPSPAAWRDPDWNPWAGLEGGP